MFRVKAEHVGRVEAIPSALEAARADRRSLLDAGCSPIGEVVQLGTRGMGAHEFPSFADPCDVALALSIAGRPGGGQVHCEPDLPFPLADGDRVGVRSADRSPTQPLLCEGRRTRGFDRKGRSTELVAATCATAPAWPAANAA